MCFKNLTEVLKYILKKSVRHGDGLPKSVHIHTLTSEAIFHSNCNGFLTINDYQWCDKHMLKLLSIFTVMNKTSLKSDANFVRAIADFFQHAKVRTGETACYKGQLSYYVLKSSKELIKRFH